MRAAGFRRAVGALLAVVLVAGGLEASAGSVSRSVPREPDPALRYLFYLHGTIVEDEGDGADSRQYGKRYAYGEILEAFAKRGFTVIGKVRPKGTRPPEYAGKVAGQVKRLTSAGVPAANITVAGHSKGGTITLFAAAQFRDPALNFVVLAACPRVGGRGTEQFLARVAPNMAGRILVAWDQADYEFGSCRAALDKAPALKGEERVLTTGEGHGLFYTPNPMWLDLVDTWAKGR